jgi:hypothetical protein
MRRGLAVLACVGLLIAAAAWWSSSRTTMTSAEVYAKSRTACEAIAARIVKSAKRQAGGNLMSIQVGVSVDIPDSGPPFNGYENSSAQARAGCREGIRLATADQ